MRAAKHVFSRTVVSDSLQPYGLQSSRLLCPWYLPGKTTRAGCHFLLQGIFPTQRSHSSLPHLLHWQADSVPLSHLGNLVQLNSPRRNNPASLDFLNSPYFMPLSVCITTICLDFFIHKIWSLFITTCLSPHLPTCLTNTKIPLTRNKAFYPQGWEDWA